MSGLVIYVGASESGNAAGADVCIPSKPGWSITLSISFRQRYQDEFSIYVVFFFFSILFSFKLIHAVNVNKTQTDVKKSSKPNAVTSEDITRPCRSHGHISMTI